MPNQGDVIRGESPAMSRGQRRLFRLLAAAGAVLVANSIYLAAVHGLERATGRLLENAVSLGMLLLHVVLGLAVVVPAALFALRHGLRARAVGNRRAIRLGVALAATLAAVTVTGFALLRVEGWFDLADPRWRYAVWLGHVLLPLLAVYFYVAHRRRGRGLEPRVVRGWLGAAAGLTLAVALAHVAASSEPLRAPEAEQRRAYFPSLVRTADGGYFEAGELMIESYCQQCHAQAHEAWSESVHRFSSFNNPAYKFSVLETRRVALARDGKIDASRWCAGCHDPAPLLTGRFDDPDFDVDGDSTALAGIGCLTCHAITEIGSTRGNADFLLELPRHYPYAFSDSELLRWASRQLIRARPELHRATFLKPLHRTSELCSTCHKVHLPPELNHYRWLRGQNHYDSFRLSGVSGHAAASFYYPEKAVSNCAECHMPLEPSQEFGARDFDGAGRRALHDHRFATANTGIAALVEMGEDAVERRRKFLEGSLRVDLFGLRERADLAGPLLAPLRPGLPALAPGGSYLVEVVVRTLRLGHEFTQGTADSNEVWLEVEALAGERRLGISGALAEDGEVDPWAHFVNAWVIDREGRRIDRRNPQDIYATVYNHQIPPGAAAVVHYRLDLPAGLAEPVTLRARLRYRKFDTTYLRLFAGVDRDNDLPIVDIARDEVTLPVGASSAGGGVGESTVPAWVRWNDYGIGLLREGGPRVAGSLAAAAAAFARVEELGRYDGALNRVRVDLAQGTVGADTVAALERAAADPAAPVWVIDWLRAQVELHRGRLDEAIAALERLTAAPSGEAARRGFDFRVDERVYELLGRARIERSAAAAGAARRADLVAAGAAFERVLELDSEHAAAHYQLSRLRRELADPVAAERHAAAFERYRQDDPARDEAVARARRSNPVADRKAEPWVVYDLTAKSSPTPGAIARQSSAGPALGSPRR